MAQTGRGPGTLEMNWPRSSSGLGPPHHRPRPREWKDVPKFTQRGAAEGSQELRPLIPSPGSLLCQQLCALS